MLMVRAAPRLPPGLQAMTAMHPAAAEGLQPKNHFAHIATLHQPVSADQERKALDAEAGVLRPDHQALRRRRCDNLDLA